MSRAKYNIRVNDGIQGVEFRQLLQLTFSYVEYTRSPVHQGYREATRRS
jgi:hypothetical protein